MKIVTLNTWGTYGPHEERVKVFLNALPGLAPDIIALQEVNNPRLTEQIKKILPLPHSFDSYEAGLVILTRFKIQTSEILRYTTISSTETEKRHAILVDLEVEEVNLTVANTHLAWKSEDEEARLGQAEELIQAVHKRGVPALLTGDFNDGPGSRPIQAIREAGYQDVYERLHPDEAGFTWDNRNPFIQTHSVKFPDRRIDFIFAHNTFADQYVFESAGLVFNRASAEGIYPSDHFGVIATIKSS
ncbi:MAG: endonuclease/exonuclease/phosphatase family protein [Candidatus Omnitrophica bacterium]|nr:endonuclease/exonuclease/phosphatase family protein [Candidatus Omnitrophota bacterium]